MLYFVLRSIDLQAFWQRVTSMHPGWIALALIVYAAQQMIDGGADVIFGAGGLTGNGALEAAFKRAKEAEGLAKEFEANVKAARFVDRRG